MLIREITIDLDKNYINKIKLHKGDTDVLLKVKLVDNYGQIYLEDTTVILNCKHVFELFKIEENIATIVIPQIITAKADEIVADIKILDKESKYSTAKIIFVVEDTVENIDIIASPEYKVFETLMQEVHEFMKNDAIVGATGPTGPTGATGPEGKGLYELAVEELGWTGTRKELIDSFVGPTGEAGPGVSIKGSFNNKTELPTTGNNLGDSYLINGNMWIYDGNETEDNTHVKGFTNVGNIQGPKGDKGDKGDAGADGKSVNIWYGTLAEYNSIVKKDENTIYLIRD